MSSSIDERDGSGDPAYGKTRSRENHGHPNQEPIMNLESVCQVRTHRDGVLSRRHFLMATGAVAGTGILGWQQALADWAPELRRRNKSCILLFMRGGPSQFETFDP